MSTRTLPVATTSWYRRPGGTGGWSAQVTNAVETVLWRFEAAGLLSRSGATEVEWYGVRGRKAGGYVTLTPLGAWGVGRLLERLDYRIE